MKVLSAFAGEDIHLLAVFGSPFSRPKAGEAHRSSPTVHHSLAWLLQTWKQGCKVKPRAATTPNRWAPEITLWV